ncbi:glycosyltransferase family 4 protein [Parvicella tangerina]|uniref:D-inositol-3-phosphate glycosyltransferase n=1 Tax=Parvicella tangerina TaxID=2829795 RepID=A0A916JR13_9FLAO|nr:glycosyltransferase family 1 protein [Parvicella tangerina]CAG5086684.1 D-inositol-3-phosphate glycosyltransferase [Parvicella tangerina]
MLLPHKLEGIGWFTYEVVKRITENHPEHQFYLFFDRRFDSKFVFGKNCHPIVLHPQARHPILYKIWFNHSIPKAVKKHSIDLFFSPDGFLSLRTNIPQIPVIHDLNFEHIPEDLPSKHTNYYKEFMPHYARIAKSILTVSEYSKQDIAETYGIPKDKIHVAYNGASEKFHLISGGEVQAIRQKYTEGSPYFVYVGALHKRKNIARMLEAFDRLKTQKNKDLKLVVVGERLFKSPDIDKAFQTMKHQRDVIFTGRLEQNELTKVVAAAKGMVYISYFEGFGIPVLEALQSGVPVLTSNKTSLPEVGGDVAIYCDPFDVTSIVEGMNQLAESTIEQSQLLAQASQFSWDKTAEKVWEVIDENLPK